MNSQSVPTGGCGLDTVEITRIEKLLQESTPQELESFFTKCELDEAGAGPGRAASLAARFAAKEACCKLFPRETALGIIGLADFAIRRDPYGAPQIDPTPEAKMVLDLHRVARVGVSLTHTSTSASAVACTYPKETEAPWYGKVLYHVLRWRRGVVVANLRRVFGDVLGEREIRCLAQAYYAHLARFLGEFVRAPFMSAAKRRAWVRVENMDTALRAHAQGKGVLLLTGHFGNWEVATTEGIGQFPQYRGLLHFIRRPLKPQWFNDFVTRRFRRSGFGTLGKQGSLESILELLSKGAIVVYVFDQHASGRDGISVDFLGHPANTFKSLAVLALNTGAPVIPAGCWREADGSHVLRFEDPLPLIECENTNEAIRRNTRAYNAALEKILLRHPEQWIWLHKRWKTSSPSQNATRSNLGFRPGAR
jgi:KDO2-lipid IV(A) lauroyltransferase